MAFVKNQAEFNQGIDLWLRRTQSVYVKYYREIVWQTFLRILEKTPQFTGRAVANWNLSVGQPDFSYNDDLGDEVSGSAGDGGRHEAHRRGHRKWINYAIARNEPKLAEIHRTSKVYINNGIRGDTDHGRSSELYLDDLQDPAYWAVKLRDVNKPYETAQQSVKVMAKRILQSHGLEFRAGGGNYGL